MSWKSRVAVAVCLSCGPLLCQTPAPARQPIAVVAGQPVYEEDILPLIRPQLMQLKSQEYDLRMRYLDGVINQKLAEAEAKKRNITSDQLIEQEVNSKVQEPTDQEIEAIYNAQKDRIGRPLADVKEQIRQALKDQKKQQTAEAFFKGLRQHATIDILLEPPRTTVSIDPARVRGNPAAPITIVEFSDFQCPFCLGVESTVRGILDKYKDKVKLAFRDFPLVSIHGQAESAGEAALCAGDQGKFWEYHDLIYASQSKLNREHLLERATQLHLDQPAFESCLTSRKYQSKVEKDLQEGMQAGVNGTPGFFINGIFLNGAQPASTFERIIDNELAHLGQKPAAPSK